MIYVTQDVAELTIRERAAATERCIECKRRTLCLAHPALFGDQAMIWVASGLAAALGLVLWL